MKVDVVLCADLFAIGSQVTLRLFVLWNIRCMTVCNAPGRKSLANYGEYDAPDRPIERLGWQPDEPRQIELSIRMNLCLARVIEAGNRWETLSRQQLPLDTQLFYHDQPMKFVTAEPYMPRRSYEHGRSLVVDDRQNAFPFAFNSKALWQEALVRSERSNYLSCSTAVRIRVAAESFGGENRAIGLGTEAELIRETIYADVFIVGQSEPAQICA